MAKYKDTKVVTVEGYRKIFCHDAPGFEHFTYQLFGVLSNNPDTGVGANLSDLKKGEKQGKHYFLIDIDEKRAAMEDRNGDQDAIRRLSFEDFSKAYKSTFYIRAFPIQDSKPKQFFADEVLQVIPAALKEQGSKMDKKLLQNYRQKWKTVNGVYKTINEAELIAVLEKFDVDKSKITLLPGLINERDLEELRLSGETSNSIRAPNNCLVMSPLQVAFRLFKEFLCQDYFCCEKKNSCKVKFKKAAIATLESLMAMDQTTFLDKSRVFHTMESVFDQKCSRCRMLDIPDTFRSYKGLMSSATIAVAKYQIDCKKWGLPIYLNFVSIGNKDMPVWMARTFLYAGWMEISLGSMQKGDIVKYLSIVFNLMVPREVLDNEYYLDFLNHLSQCTDKLWPVPGSMLEKLLKGQQEKVVISFKGFSNWLEAAEKAWQLPENSSKPMASGFPEIN